MAADLISQAEHDELAQSVLITHAKGLVTRVQEQLTRQLKGLEEAIGVTVLRAQTPVELVDTVEQAATMAYDADQQIAVLIGQRLLGEKKW